MVPCQPRQLVILSLPFAALVAFFWYKRRRSLSRSDPGGTLSSTKLVDKSVSASEPATEEIEDDLCASTKGGIGIKQSEGKGEGFVLKTVETVICSTPKSKTSLEETILFPVNKISDEVVNNKIGIGSINKSIAIEQNNSIKLINKSEKEECVIKDFPLSTNNDVDVKQLSVTDFEKDFNCTGVEKIKSINGFRHNWSIEDNEQVEIGNLQNLISNASDNTEQDCVNKVDGKIETKHICVELSDQKEIKNGSIPLKELRSVIALKNNFVLRDTLESISDQSLESISTFDDTIVSQSDSNLEDTLVDNIKPTEKVERSSTEEVASCSSSSSSDMAQGQKVEEKQGEVEMVGLEQKLVSLGLDTQQPTQRDSANHSPAEVMLNSPAISNFSDAHSEGSSDSGKGCSDVVTPPSRTPAGGSSVAGDQVPSVYEFVLPQLIVGRLIGRHGAFLHDIRAKTHTNVFIKRHPESTNLKVCAIEGTTQDIDAALKMIRQKFPQRRFPDLTLERVSFVKNSLPISPENMQLHLVEGVNNDVILSSLITAGHFFLQLPMHMSYQSLYRLACCMNTVYNTEDSPPLPDPRPDVVCVVPAHGGWYRAQILSVDEENNTSDIRFLDYGGFITVDNSTLRQIRGDFLLLPFQAVECALANVVPAGGEEEWSEEAKQFVQLMTTQQVLQAQVYDYTDTGLPLVYLYCTQFYQSPSDPAVLESRVVLLNQELVARGFAELIEAWQDDTQLTTESS